MYEAGKAGTDIWVIPAAGGTRWRLTFHPATETGTGGRHEARYGGYLDSGLKSIVYLTQARSMEQLDPKSLSSSRRGRIADAPANR